MIKFIYLILLTSPAKDNQFISIYYTLFNYQIYLIIFYLFHLIDKYNPFLIDKI